MLDLLKAFKPLAADFLSTILFVALYAITGNIYLATVLGIVAGIIQITYLKWRGRVIANMQWMSLALVIVLGTATLLTRDPRFVMIKPSIGTFAVGCVMLQRNWMARYLPAIVTDTLGSEVTVVWGYVWAAAMFSLAGANLAVAFLLGPRDWAWFVAVVPTTVQLSLFLIQYLSIRRAVRRHLRLQAQAEPDG